MSQQFCGRKILFAQFIKKKCNFAGKKATTTPTSVPISLFPTGKNVKIFQKRELPSEQLLKMLVKNVVLLDGFGYYEKFYLGKDLSNICSIAVKNCNCWCTTYF